MNKKRTSILVFGVMIFLVILGVVGGFLWRAWIPQFVEENFPTPTPLESRIQAAQISYTDFPRGWYQDGAKYEDTPGTLISRLLWFYGPDKKLNTWVSASQRLFIYPDEESAQSAYEEKLETFDDAWSVQHKLIIDGYADDMYTTCLPSGQVEDVAYSVCLSVGLYDDTLSIFMAGVFEEGWLTMADFQSVVIAMDQQLKASLDMREQ